MIPLLLATASAAEDIEEVVVYGDLFARWDNTRWMVATEIATPLAFQLMRDENDEFWSSEILVRSVIACDKDWKLGKHRYEVGCQIEEIAVRAAVAEERVSDADIVRAQRVLNEIDAKLTGSLLQLHVADDGRVTGIDLDGLGGGNTRENSMAETLRQLMSRQITGFNLKLRKFNQLHEGKWHEYNSSLLSMPIPAVNGRSGTAATGSNLLVHYLNDYRGQTVVQSIGKGVVQLTDQSRPRSFDLDLIGVSIFDRDEGYMLERVWALKGVETAATATFSASRYFTAGRIQMLGTQDKPDCGLTEVVNGRDQRVEGLPAWESIEQ